MKTQFVFVSVVLGITLGAGVVHATNYAGGSGKPLTVGACTLVDSRTEANATHVYTTNPDYVVKIGYLYGRYFFRDPRCDELQFHVDHNNSLSKIEVWLSARVADRLVAGYYNGQTISTDRHEWFFMKDGQAHRIPDWLTGLSNGLLINDRISFYFGMTSTFYAKVKIGPPVQFADGTYAAKITNIWKNGDRDYSSLPPKMANEINSFVEVSSYYSSIFATCLFQPRYPGDPYWSIFDWSWLLRNPGCALAS